MSGSNYFLYAPFLDPSFDLAAFQQSRLARLAMAYSIWVALVVGAGAEINRHEPAECEDGAEIEPGFFVHTIDVDGVERCFDIYVPAEYDGSRSWPLIVALHGIGEAGSDLIAHTRVGVGFGVRTHPELYPALVLMPQITPGTGRWQRGEGHIDEALARTLALYNVDPNRITLTGYSIGGDGTFRYGAEHSEVFAGLLPIASTGALQDVPGLLDVPIWAIRNRYDFTSSRGQARLVALAIAQGGGAIRYEEWPGFRHDVWTEAYANPEVVQWLLAQEKDNDRHE